MPAFNADALGGGPDALGWLMGAMGVGAILGSLLLARMGESRHKGKALIGLALAWALASGLFAVSRELLLAVVLAALVGLASSMFMSLIMSLIQISASAEMRGRVMSVTMLTWGLMPLGVLPISFLAERLGIGSALVVSAVALAVLTLLVAFAFPVLRRIDRGYTIE